MDSRIEIIVSVLVLILFFVILILLYRLCNNTQNQSARIEPVPAKKIIIEDDGTFHGNNPLLLLPTI